MLKHQVLQLKRLNISNQDNHEELEWYGRCLCLRIDGILDSVKSLFKEAKVNIPEPVIDCAHRIRSRYQDASSNNYCKSLIIHFTTFRHRTMFYRAKIS